MGGVVGVGVIKIVLALNNSIKLFFLLFYSNHKGNCTTFVLQKDA